VNWKGIAMNRATNLVVACLVAVFLMSCSGDNGDKNEPTPDVTDISADSYTESDEQSTNCLGNDGQPCDDGNPCHVGEGICLAGECFYEPEQKIDCSTSPDECSVHAGCADEQCLWELSPGWCKIGDQCIEDGATNPDNECKQCRPEENRGDWSPISGISCTPEGNECTATGTCQEGFCVPKASDQQCAVDTDCISFDDGNACNGEFICVDCGCIFDDASVVECDPSEDTDCAKVSCNPDTGKCQMNPVMDGTTCDDDNPCTATDYCVGGECQSGEVAPPIWSPAKAVNTAYITSVRFHGVTNPVLYAVGSGGVFYRSKDLGEHFEESDLVAPGSDLGDWLWVAGEGTANILAIFGDKLVVSNNSGITYNEKLAGCEALTQAALAPTTYLAVCDKKLHLSNNSGATWEQLNNVPVGGGVVITGLAAKDSNTVYVGSAEEDGMGRGYVYRSQDGGANWESIDPPDRPDVAQVSHRGLFISPKAAERLFVGYSTPDGSLFPFGQVPLFRSDDGGNAFSPLNANVQGSSYVPMALDSIGRLLLAVDNGINRGGNYGTGPWGHIPEPNSPGNILFHQVTSVAIQPGNDFSFYLPVGNGVARASELGAVWALLHNGMNGAIFSTITACNDNLTMYALERLSGGLYKSPDGGTTWAQLSLPTEASETEITSLVCSPASSATVHAFGADGSQVFSSNGQTFSYLSEMTGPSLASYNALATFPGSPLRLVVSRLGMGLFTAEDGALPQGAGYTPLSLSESYVSDVIADPFENGRLYVGTYATPETKAAKVYTCTDFGASCSMKLQTGSISADAPPTSFNLFVDRGMPGRIYAIVTGENAKVHYSNDHGNSWQELVSLPLLSIRPSGEILPDRDVKGSVYAAFVQHGLHYYNELEVDWMTLDETPEVISSLVYEPGEAGAMLAGSAADSKIHKSTDGGMTFTLEHDFSVTNFHVARLVSDNEYLFAILQGRAHNESKLFLRIGAQWSEGLVGTAITDIAVLQPENEMVLAAGKFGGLFLSDDGGESFAPFGQLDGAATDLLVSPADANTVFAAMDCGQLPAWYDPNQSFLGSDCGVKRSVDGGATWFTVLNSGKRCTSVTVAPDNTNLLIATCPGAGTYITLDGGTSWDTVSGWSHLTSVTSAVISKSIIYFGTHGRGLARADIDSVSGNISNWQGNFSEPVRKLLPVQRAFLEIQPDNPSRVQIACQPGGLIRTDDFGTNWRYSGERLSGEAGSMSSDASGPAMLPRYVDTPEGYALWVAVSGKGIYVSRDQGEHFVFSSAASLPVSTSHPVALVSHDDFSNYVWLATREGFFRSADLGTVWQKIETGLPAGVIQDVIPPFNNNIYVSVAGAGIYSVPFDGAGWTKTHAVDFYGFEAPPWPGRDFGLWHFVSADPASSKTLLVGLDPFGLFRSLDGGITYKQVGDGLPAGAVVGLARSPHSTQQIIAGTPQGPFISTDGGDKFFGLPNGPANCYSFGFDADETQTLYALCADGLPHGLSSGPEGGYGIRTFWLSTDLGETWSAGANGIDSGKHPVQVLADPDASGTIYVATLEGGILRSTDGGTIFSPWSTGLPAPYTGGRDLLHSSPMSFTPDGSSVLVGTDGFGFYSRILNAMCE
jgi:photosystem II stability/assembly factor-like uncharacterized protein